MTMMQRLNWLPPRTHPGQALDTSDDESQSDEGTPGIVCLLIRQLAYGAWSTLARLLQLACRTLDLAPGLTHKWAEAGTTGIVLDVLYRAPRHHSSWKLLSTAGAGLLAVLVRCEGGTEAAQPQALRMLLSMLERHTTCGPARQAVATVLHCLVAQRTVHRDKLLAAGALPVLLRVLRRVDVLCDLVAVQEILWVIAYLTEDGAAPLVGVAAETDELQAAVASQLVPLLLLYGMPAHTQHAHLAALVIRALHVQVASSDRGKDALRAAGALPALVDLVRRHSAPYVAAAAAFAEQASSDGQRPPPQRAGSSHNQRIVTHGSLQLGATRPPAHEDCDVHGERGGSQGAQKAARGEGPLGGGAASAALGPWTPWHRFTMALLICGMVPELVPQPRKGSAPRDAGTAAGVPTRSAGPGASAAGGADDTDADADGAATPSPIASEDDTDEELDAGPEAADSSALQAAGGPEGAAAPTASSAAGTDPWAARVAAGARLASYGLLLPLLSEDAGSDAAAGSGAGSSGAGTAALGGALLRRRLCPLRESLAALKTLMCDCEANQELAGQLGLVPLLVQLVAHGDMGLAWQAAEAAVYLSRGATGAALVAAGAVEELAYLLQESAEALHGLTLRKQIQLQASTLAAADGQPHGHGRRSAGRPPPASSSPYAGGAGAAATLASVHVRPCPEPPVARPPRLYLVGRLPLDFTTSSCCFYGSHDAASYCDYCTPSAAIKALLRLLTAPAGAAAAAGAAAVNGGGRSSDVWDSGSESDTDGEVPDGAAAVRRGGGGGGGRGAPAEAAVCRRFAAAGGLYGALLLLHHEAAGVHHSKLAASLLTLTDCVLRHDPGAQDELRTAGGLGVLTALLESLLRPGVMDVYQLRVATCRTLGLALAGNAANKLAAREHGVLLLLASLVTGLAERRKAISSELVVDDDSVLSVACLDALAAAASGSPGTQEALVALGLLHPACQLVRDERLETEVRAAAARTLAAVVDGQPEGQRGALALDVVKPAVAWLARCATAAANTTPAAQPRPADAAAAAELSLAMMRLLAAILRGGAAAAAAKAAAVPAGALQALLEVLRSPGPAIAGTACAYDGAAAHRAAAAELAAGLLAALADGDVDLQNELVSQGALTVAADVIRDGGAAAPQALQLLSVLLRSNTFAKNTARGAGLPAALVGAARRCGLARSAATAAAVGALSELAAGNHANQEAVAVEGGLEVAVELVREACGVLPFGALRAAAAVGEGGAAVEALGGGGGEAAAGDGGPVGLLGATAGGDGGLMSGLENAAESDEAADTVAVAAAEAAAAAAAEAAEAAAAVSRLLRALFGLVSACAELNARNQSYVRELGGVGLLADFLTTASEALTSTPLRQGPQRPRWAQGQEAEARLRSAVAAARAALSPAVAAACGATAALVRDCGANLERLEEQPRLPVALFKLLVATDAPTSCAAANAIEWLVIRSAIQLDALSREAFELTVLDLLVLALYVPYGPIQLAARGGGNDGFGYMAAAAQRHQQQMRHGPWHMAVTSLMPAEGLTAGAVRDAVAVLTAVADAADSLAAAAPQPHGQQVPQKAAAVGAMGRAASGKPRAPQASLAPLEPAPLAPVATDHASGLVLSSTLSGRLGLGGASSQGRWAELAGSAAAAFQRVANGPLLQAAPANSAGGGATAAAAASAAPGAGAAAAAAQERRRQVAWMVFLLAVHSPDNRARVRQLLRTSLTPLAQQLTNAEACRAQLEAAAVLAAGTSAPSTLRSGSFDSGAALPAATQVAPMSSAAMESASSLQGRLPVSTPALVVPAPGSPGLRRVQPAGSAGPQDTDGSQSSRSLHSTAAASPVPSAALYVQGQANEVGPAGMAAGHLAVPYSPQPPAHPAAASAATPPHAPAARAETPSPAAAGVFPPSSSARHAGGCAALYGNLYGPPSATRPPTPPASVLATPRDALVQVPHGSSSASSTPLAASLQEPASGRWAAGGRHTASGSGYSVTAASAIFAAGGSGSGGATPRLSLSGAAAAAFASPAPGPYAAAAGHGSRGPSPSSRRAVRLQSSPAERGVGSGLLWPSAGAVYPSSSPSPGYAAAAAVAAGVVPPAPAAPGVPPSRALRAQVSAGGSSSVMSDDDELTMIQQEVALLATTTSSLSGSAARSGTPSAVNKQSPASSPAHWGQARR